MYDIVEKNQHFIVVYKKPGVSFHSDTGVPGLFETIKQQESLDELYPVHRLDKVTSGVLVMARTAAVNLELCEQFRLRQVGKYYLALSAKKPKKKQGLVKGDMLPARRGAWMLTNSVKNPAITQFFSCSVGQGRRLFLIKPLSGKTHQIRVALKSLGAPILGDCLYGDKLTQQNIDRTYLHAFSIAFRVNGEMFRYQELPREGVEFIAPTVVAACAKYGEPWAQPWPGVDFPTLLESINDTD